MPGFLGGSSGGSTGTGGEITFPKEFVDPVTKLRVSQPENLIDTDFEYGLQPTKWETVELINNTPSFFSKSGDTTIPGIVSITTNAGTREITVTTALDHGLAVGIPINVQGTKSVTADGSYIINSIPNPTTFTYLCKDTQPQTLSIEDLYSSIITGEFFQGSQLRIADSDGIVTDAASLSELTVTTESPHGFGPNTPFYFLNLNSTISQEFEATNTAAKSFDASNSATAQTFDGSNTQSTTNVDWSNSGVSTGTESTVSSVDLNNNTITVSHNIDNFANLRLGDPLYYDVQSSTGYFSANPRGVVFLKTIDQLDVGSSTFEVSATPDGATINIEANISGTFQLSNEARTFAGNNINPLTETEFIVVRDSEFSFDGANEFSLSSGTVTNYSGNLISIDADDASGALDFYQGAMVLFTVSGGAAPTGLTANTTYFVDQFFPVSEGSYNMTIKEFPDSANPVSVSSQGTATTQQFTKIGISIDKDVFHIQSSNFAEGDMLEYSYPVGGRFDTAEAANEKDFYFVETAYDAHNYKLTLSSFTPTSATGGDETFDIIQGGVTFRVHKFTTTGTSTFTVNQAGTITDAEVLIVAGGGGGGGDNSGGGGAGGVLQETVTLSQQSYDIVVGAGGAGAPQVNTLGSSGQDSSAFGFTAIGGGRGGTGNSGMYNGASGGSGGGAAAEGTNGSGGSGTSGQGNRGGDGRGGDAGGGGGGAGGPGQNGDARGNQLGGDGGQGVNLDFDGTARWYAAGGNGGNQNGVYNSRPAVNGIGGRTNTSGSSRATAGAANTGSGGGGVTWTAPENPLGGAGGSGIVIIKYQISA